MDSKTSDILAEEWKEELTYAAHAQMALAFADFFTDVLYVSFVPFEYPVLLAFAIASLLMPHIMFVVRFYNPYFAERVRQSLIECTADLQGVPRALYESCLKLQYTDYNAHGEARHLREYSTALRFVGTTILAYGAIGLLVLSSPVVVVVCVVGGAVALLALLLLYVLLWALVLVTKIVISPSIFRVLFFGLDPGDRGTTLTLTLTLTLTPAVSLSLSLSLSPSLSPSPSPSLSLSLSPSPSLSLSLSLWLSSI